MKALKPINSIAPQSSSVEAILQEMREGLYDLNSPNEAQYAELYHVLADEHQRAIDLKEQEMIDLLRSVMTNAHLILTLANPNNFTPNQPDAGCPKTIRALMHQRDQLEKKHE